MKKKTAEEKVEFIKKWSDWFYQHTDSFGHGNYPGDILGVDLAYLYAAICRGTYVELYKNTELVELLKANDIPKDNDIWSYIKVIDE